MGQSLNDPGRAALPRGFHRLIAAQFCGSTKSLATGVPMAGLVFPEAIAGKVLLPLMVFHQIQLMVVAVIAQRWGRRSPRD